MSIAVVPSITGRRGTRGTGLRLSIDSEVDAVEWNDFVARHSAGTLFQTTHWEAFLKQYLDVPTYFATARSETGELVGSMLFWNEPFGYRQFLFERPVVSLFGSAFQRFLPAMQWLYGPLVHSQDPLESVEITRSILKEINDFSVAAGAVGIAGSPAPIHDPGAPDLGKLFEAEGFAAREWATYLVTLDDQLWESFDKSVRKAVRRTEKAGVVVERIANLTQLRDYYEQAVPSWRSRGARIFSFENYFVMWEVLRPVGAVEFFVARRDGEQLGGLGVWAFNGILTEFGVVRSQQSIDEKLYVGDLIKWGIMKWGVAQGFRLYDLAGVSPTPGAGKEEGILRFKKKWGGMPVGYSMFEKRFPGLKSSALATAESLMRRRKRAVSEEGA